jgi:hypothetical protein
MVTLLVTASVLYCGSGIVRLKKRIGGTETVFDSNMNLGFREVIADTSAAG